MTDEGTRYVELAAELKDLKASHPRYIEVVVEMDHIWWRLVVSDQEELDDLLVTIDTAENSKHACPAGNE